jgi:hypothetical protein
VLATIVAEIAPWRRSRQSHNYEIRLRSRLLQILTILSKYLIKKPSLIKIKKIQRPQKYSCWTWRQNLDFRLRGARRNIYSSATQPPRPPSAALLTGIFLRSAMAKTEERLAQALSELELSNSTSLEETERLNKVSKYSRP